MRAHVQRVTEASVTVEGREVARIGPGLCVLVGVGHGDGATDAARLAERLWRLRVFEDDAGRMNLSAEDLGRELLVVSQFTLYADTSRGRRPSFVAAAPPQGAEPLVEHLCSTLEGLGARVARGQFRAHMQVGLVNDGPVTLLLET